MKAIHLAAIVSYALPALLYGQQAGGAARDCEASRVEALQPTQIPAPEVVELPQVRFATILPQLRQGHFVKGAEDMLDAFADEQTLWPDSLRLKFRHEADALLIALKSAEVAAASNRPAILNANFFLPQVSSADGSAYQLFTFDPPNTLEFTDSFPSPNVRRSVCWQALALQLIVSDITPVGYATGAAVFKERAADWKAYHRSSYAQFPWERLATDAIDRAAFHSLDQLTPPIVQAILLHPGVGSVVTGSVASWKHRRLSSSPTLWWEIVGVAVYSRHYQNRWGLSAVLSASQTGGTGFGPMLHLSKYAIGYVFQQKSETGHRRALLMTIDLYKLLGGGTSTPAAVAAADSVIRIH